MLYNSVMKRKPLTQEHKEKLRKAMLGRVFTTEWKQKISEAKKGNQDGFTKGHKYNVGRKQSEETKKKRSLKLLGNTNGFKKGGTSWNKGRSMSKETRVKLSKSLVGRKHTLDTRLKISKGLKGEKSHLWKGGITAKNAKIRCSFKYKQWRKTVFERDNYTCVLCGEKGVQLNADHIKPFAYYPKLRFKVSNGRTLCVACHKKTDTYLNNKKLTTS